MKKDFLNGDSDLRSSGQEVLFKVVWLYGQNQGACLNNA